MTTGILAGSTEEHTGQLQPDPPEQAEDRAIVDEVVERFALVTSVESAQRRQEDDDLEFEGVDMWGQDARESRDEHTDAVSGQRVAARPTLTINLIEQRVQQVIAEARQARLGVSVQPKAGLANTKQAGYYKGLIRSIQAESGAGEVRLWALERSAKCGRGAYRIEVDFANDGDFDLDVVLKRILDQSTVYWDPYAQLADRSDADWCLLSDLMSEKERLRRWPDKPIRPSPGAWEGMNDPWFVADDHNNKSVRVATYYKVVYHEQTLVHHPKLGTIGPMPFAKLLPELQEAVSTKHPSVRVRRVDVREVWQYIVDGTQVLEKDPWLGRYIPVIPVTGKEYNVKGKRSWKGLATNVKDLNRGYNVAISSAVEAAGSMPRAPYIMVAGQDEGFEQMWDDSPIKAFTRLYVNPVAIDGKPAPMPQRQNQEPAIQGALLLARALKEDIGSVTGSVDPASKAVRPYDRSGKAIEALQRQGAAGTSNFLDNLATISMTYEGRCLIDLIPKVYDRPGRVIGVMGEDHDDESAVMLMTPFVRDEDGNPIPVPCGMCQGRGEVRPPRTFTNVFPAPESCPACQGSKQATRETMPKTYEGKPVEYVDLSEGQFKVSVAIGRNYQTKQEEAMNAMSQLATAAPPLVPVYADLWVRAMGFSGSTEIADRLKKMNPNAKDEKDAAPEIPPEFQQQFQQLQMEHQAAMQQLQKATNAIQADTVKMEGEKALLAMKLEAATGLENLKQQNKLMQLTTQAETDKNTELLRGHLETMRLESEQRHEVLLELIQQKRLDASRQEDRVDSRLSRQADREDTEAERQEEQRRAAIAQQTTEGQ